MEEAEAEASGREAAKHLLNRFTCCLPRAEPMSWALAWLQQSAHMMNAHCICLLVHYAAYVADLRVTPFASSTSSLLISHSLSPPPTAYPIKVQQCRSAQLLMGWSWHIDSLRIKGLVYRLVDERRMGWYSRTLTTIYCKYYRLVLYRKRQNFEAFQRRIFKHNVILFSISRHWRRICIHALQDALF